MIQETSLEAYQSIEPNLGKRQEQILEVLKLIQPANNRMISERANLPINQVTPRIQELRNKLKLVTVAFEKLDPLTRRNTIYWKPTSQ